jgi:uncharacterized protein YqgC (DUF456 family)
MNASEIMGFVLTLLVMLVGVAGAVLPGLPGTPLIFIAALVHRLVFGERGASVLVIVVCGVIAAVSLVMEILATTYGAKRMGATWRGILGAGLGAVVGLFFAPLGLIFGPLLGAFIGEALGGRDAREAGKAGLGAFIGLIVGAAGKLACAVTMIGLWTLNVLLGAAGKLAP